MPFSSRLILVNLALFSLIITSVAPAEAVEINDKGAAQLKTMLNAHIDNYRSSAKNAGGDLITDGDISIEQGADYYAATLPATTYKTALDSNIKIGLIAINAVPTDDADKWKITMAIPTPILITGKDDVVKQRIDIGDQKMGGLWSAKLENFAKLSANYNDLKFTFVDKGDFINVDNIKIQSDLKETKDNLWSGPTNIVVSDLHGGSVAVPEEIKLNEMTVSIDVENFSPKSQQEALNKLAGADADDGNFSNILSQLIKASGNFDTQVALKGLKINDTVNPNNTVKNIGLIEFGFKSNTGAGDKIDQAMNISYSGLSLKDGAAISALIPRKFNMALSLDNFPFAEVMDFAGETLGNGNAESAKQVAATRAMNELPQKFKDAGTILTLKGINFSNSDYSVAIKGLLKAEPKSQIGGIGNLNIVTTGLDNILTALKENPMGSMALQPLNIFRVMSNQEGNKNTILFKLEEDGSVTANGKNMGIKAGGAAPAPTSENNSTDKTAQ